MKPRTVLVTLELLTDLKVKDLKVDLLRVIHQELDTVWVEQIQCNIVKETK